MDKLFVRKDVYEEFLEKGFGKKDLSKLTKKKITDKNGHTRTVYVRNGEQPAEMKQPKAQEGLTPEKKARYEEMLEKVKAGSDENALFVRGEMLNKKDAIDYLEKKLGRKNGVVAEQKMKMEDEKKDAAMKDQGTKSSEQMLDEKAKENFKKDARKMSDKGLEQKIKNLTTPGSLDYQVYSNPEQIAKVFEEELNRRKTEKNSAAQGHLESDTPQNTDITKEDEERFGKQALSGLSGKRTNSEEKKTPKLGLKVGDTAFTKYGERAEIVEVDGEWVTAKMNGRTEKYKENAFQGKVEKKPSQDDMKENYLDARNEAGKDIADENRIDNHADKAFNLDKSDTKALDKFFEKLSKDTTYKPHYVIGNYLSKENKELFSKLHKMEDEYKEKHPEAEGKTFAYDLSEKYIKDEFEKFKKKKTIDSFAETFKELLD